METVYHPAASRGHANWGWLDTRHSFSFADYYDPERIHFGMLRVLNDDLIAGGGGFGRHPHDNMEITTIVLEGELEHKDSMGHTMSIKPDEVQVMSAGTGIFHSEYNRSSDIPLKLLQVWVFPDRKNLTPRYDQRAFDPAGRKNRWQTLISPGEPGTLRLSQQAWFSRIAPEAGSSNEYKLHAEGHGAYIFLIDGKAEAADRILEKHDGLGIWETSSFSLKALTDAEVLVIEVPMR